MYYESKGYAKATLLSERENYLIFSNGYLIQEENE